METHAGGKRDGGSQDLRGLMSLLAECESLDPIDREIIARLLVDARISHAELGRHVGLSRVAVRDRVQRLVEQGVIEEFTVVLNGQKLGYAVNAFFEIQVVPERLESVCQALAAHPRVTVVYQMTGPTTLHVHAHARDPQDLAQFMQSHIYSIPGVVGVASHLLLRRFKSVLSIR
ncbi:MAG TPA: Lrp/AsnC family transcriptional regulator [Limnochordales bacterium]